MVFGVVTAEDYRRKVEEDLEELERHPSDARRAINAVRSVYHLHECLWAKSLKQRTPFQLDEVTIIRTKKGFLDWLESACPRFRLVQDLTNGSKHACYADAGGRMEGFGTGPFGVGPYGHPYLLIDMGKDEAERRYLVGATVITEAGSFMVDLAKRIGC